MEGREVDEDKAVAEGVQAISLGHEVSDATAQTRVRQDHEDKVVTRPEAEAEAEPAAATVGEEADMPARSAHDDLVLEVALAVYREELIQSARIRLRLAEEVDDDGEGQYTRTRFGLEGAENAERELQAIDAKTATMLELGRKEDPSAVRKFLKNTLTTLRFDLPEELNLRIDALLQAERKDSKEVALEDIPRLYEGAKIAVWRGDITTLQIDGIVNAANEYMLGCFTPNHPCIDNAIHCKAGPRLREACRNFMREQGHLEKTGVAKITPGYNLPSKYVLHTVGPICKPKGHIGSGQADQLRSCYWECLELAKQHGLRSVAFCCISTGVFGYPQEDAARLALETVKQWLAKDENEKSMDLVVFNVFTPRDLQIYNDLAPQFFAPPATDASATEN